jgi:hypothetical protein
MLGDTVVATALLDRLLHHAVVVHIEGASYRLRRHADLIQDSARVRPITQPIPVPPKRGRPPKPRPTKLDPNAKAWFSKCADAVGDDEDAGSGQQGQDDVAEPVLAPI